MDISTNGTNDSGLMALAIANELKKNESIEKQFVFVGHFLLVHFVALEFIKKSYLRFEINAESDRLA